MDRDGFWAVGAFEHLHSLKCTLRCELGAGVAPGKKIGEVRCALGALPDVFKLQSSTI